MSAGDGVQKMSFQLLTRLLMLLILFLFPLKQATAETVLYCQSELATGIFEENGKYDTSKFQPERYTVKVVGDFSEIFIKNRIYDCRPSFGSSYKPHLITCFHTAKLSDSGNRVDYGGMPEVFFYNRELKRFIFANLSTSGYGSNDTDTDVLFAGKCETF